jgi:hypothetical protein
MSFIPDVLSPLRLTSGKGHLPQKNTSQNSCPNPPIGRRIDQSLQEDSPINITLSKRLSTAFINP